MWLALRNIFEKRVVYSLRGSVAQPHSELACIYTLASNVTVVLVELSHEAMRASDEYSLPPADGATVVSGVSEEVEEGHGLLSCVPLSYTQLCPPQSHSVRFADWHRARGVVHLYQAPGRHAPMRIEALS